MMPNHHDNEYTYKRDFSDGSYNIYKYDDGGKLRHVTTAASEQEAIEAIDFLRNSSSSTKRKNKHVIDDDFRATWNDVFGTDLQ
jgi:hypothetical protein